MDASYILKRHSDIATTTDHTAKRRHHNNNSASTSKLPPLLPKPVATGASFRILCPASKAGGVIGKGGSIVQHFREETGAKIQIDDVVPGCLDRVITIIDDAVKTKKDIFTRDDSQCTVDDELWNSSGGEDEVSPAQQALLRVFERILKVGEEKSSNFSETVARLLVPDNHVGCVIGRGGKIVEKIRQESAAEVRILTKEKIPSCASGDDSLIQISGNISAVKKALLSVTSCLQANFRPDASSSAATKPVGVGTGTPAHMDPFLQRGYASGLHAVDYHSRSPPNTGSDNIGVNNRMVLEEEVVFRLLCQLDKVGNLIGKGGVIIRALQIDSGASIKIVDTAPSPDERVVLISARESAEQNHSPAQEAVIRVQCKIAEIGFEPGAAVIARLLVPSQQIGCLLSKGGIIISDMRRATGASIRVFPNEEVPRFGSQNDGLVQVIGSLKSVQDALFHITSRLRETIFPVKSPLPSVIGSSYVSPFKEMPPPSYRPRHDPPSPSHYSSSIGFRHGVDRSSVPSQSHDHHSAFSYGMEHNGPSVDRIPYPRPWAHQALSRGVPDFGSDMASRNWPVGSGSKVPEMTNTVEVVVPQTLLNHVYGENNSNLNEIRKISGAMVVIHDPRLGATEGAVVVTGSPKQTRVAQMLIQAFILCGKTPSS